MTAAELLEKIRWHAESGASAFDNMGAKEAAVCMRVRLLGILKLLDERDGVRFNPDEYRGVGYAGPTIVVSNVVNIFDPRDR